METNRKVILEILRQIDEHPERMRTIHKVKPEPRHVSPEASIATCNPGELPPSSATCAPGICFPEYDMYSGLQALGVDQDSENQVLDAIELLLNVS